MNVAAVPLLRPMRVPELMDATIRLYRKNFLLLLAIVAVIYVPLTAIDALTSVPAARAQQEFQNAALAMAADDGVLPSSMARWYLWVGIQLVITATLGFISTSLMSAAVAWAVAERHLERPVTVGLAYRAMAGRWRSILGAAALTVLIYAALGVVLIVPCIGWITGIPGLIFAYLCLRFVPQAVILEGLPARQAIRRSWFLTKPHFWRVAGIVGLLWILGILITAGPAYLVTAGLVFLAPSLMVQSLVSTAVSGVLNLIYLPIRLSGETLVYYDLRVRQEGLDLEMELDALQLELSAEGYWGLDDEPVLGLDTAQPAPAAPPAGRASFLTRQDVRNMGILLGVAVLGIALCAGVYFAFVALMMGPVMRGMSPSFGDLQQSLTVTAAVEELRQALTATPIP